MLILASGSFTHDLRSADWRGANKAPGRVTGFADRVNAAAREGRIEDLINYRKLAPFAAHNHPAEEHFLALFVAPGAGRSKARSLHTSLTFSALRMDAFEFAA